MDLKNISGITLKMLISQLRELENDKIIERKVYSVVPPKVEYFLTPKGESLIPILLELKNGENSLILIKIRLSKIIRRRFR